MTTILTTAIHQYPRLPKGNSISIQGFFELIGNVSDFPQLPPKRTLPTTLLGPFHRVRFGDCFLSYRIAASPRLIVGPEQCFRLSIFIWWWPGKLGASGSEFTDRNEGRDLPCP